MSVRPCRFPSPPVLRDKRSDGFGRVHDVGGNEKIEVGDISLGAVAFKEPFESPDIAQAGDLSFTLDLTHHPQAAHDKRVTIGDSDGGLGFA